MRFRSWESSGLQRHSDETLDRPILEITGTAAEWVQSGELRDCLEQPRRTPYQVTPKDFIVLLQSLETPEQCEYWIYMILKETEPPLGLVAPKYPVASLPYLVWDIKRNWDAGFVAVRWWRLILPSLWWHSVTLMDFITIGSWSGRIMCCGITSIPMVVFAQYV